MTNSLRFFVNSYWSSEDMKPTSTPLSLLTHDLAARSSGSSGRDLTDRLENYCFDLRGSASPLGFAQLLQGSEPENRKALEELLEWTAIDNDFLLIALVAMSPELELAASRLAWGRPSDDTVSEVLTQATVALRWTHELVEGERVDFVLSHAHSRTRAEQRRMARHNVPTERIPVDYDAEESEAEPLDISTYMLQHAVASRVITDEESLLIQHTRRGESSLQEFADESTETYEALRKRRKRAEAKLRHHFRSEGAVR